MSRYRSWATEDPVSGVALRRRPPRQDVRSGPIPLPDTPQQLVVYVPEEEPRRPPPTAQIYSPPPRPVVVQIPKFTRPEPTPARRPAARSCAVVKGGDPNYERFVSGLPDLAEESGIDLSEGVDAMSLSGRPEFAEMRDWRPTSAYYNGVTDATARGTLDGHVGRSGESVGDIRSSQATVRHVTGTIRSLDDV